jgi:hypothetical protein
MSEDLIIQHLKPIAVAPARDEIELPAAIMSVQEPVCFPEEDLEPSLLSLAP